MISEIVAAIGIFSDMADVPNRSDRKLSHTVCGGSVFGDQMRLRKSHVVGLGDRGAALLARHVTQNGPVTSISPIFK